jgi:serine/threonine-protein kinase
MAGETSAGFFKGKINYISPEQALGLPVDGRADVWAIGAILYEGLAGRLPFEGANQLGTLHLLTAGKPPPPLPESIPSPVRSVVERALMHEASARFWSAAEMRSAIERAMVESGLTASTADVAAFVAEHLADRTARRREAIELALKAAAERERLNALLVKPSGDTSSDFHVVRPSEKTLTVPDMLGKVPAPEGDSSGSSPGSGTLGRASLTSAADVAPKSGRALVLAALGGGTVVAALTLVAMVALRGSSSPSAAASSAAASVAQPTTPSAPASIAVVPSVAPEPSASTEPAASTDTPVAPRPTVARPSPATRPPPARPSPTKAPKVFDNGF